MKPRITNVFAICGLAALGGLMQGLSNASLSAILATQQYKDYFSHPSGIVQGGIVAALPGGCLLGSLLSSCTGDRLGRRDSLALGCVIFIIGSCIIAAAQNREMLIAARVINGIGVGVMTGQGPIYIAEMSPSHCRGRIMAVQQWMITWGLLIMYYMSYGASFIQSTVSFRLPWALQAVPAFCLLLCLPLMPRSPRWLASRGRLDEARDTLALVRSGFSTQTSCDDEFQEIKAYVEQDKQYRSTSWGELITRRNVVRFHCALVTLIWSQFSGTNALIYYIVYIFQMAGIQGNTNLAVSSIQYVINVVMTIPALLLLDRLPRRTVMISGSLVMASLLFITAGLMGSYGHAMLDGLDGTATVTWTLDAGGASKAIIACTYLFIATFATTWGPIGWIYPSEITPLHVRSKAVSLAAASNWACNFALTLFTPYAFQRIQWRFYLIFGSCCVAAAVHVFLFFQETRGKTLEQMDEVFGRSLFAFKRSKGEQQTGQNAASDKV